MPSSGSIVPGAFESSYTRPTTRFVGWTEEEGLAPAGAGEPRLAHAHLPLVLMLVLTQAAVGISVAAQLTSSTALGVLALTFGAIGLASSVFHLGQPLKAWRCFLGWRRSWLSREILAFGIFMKAAMALTLCHLLAYSENIIGCSSS